MSEHVWKFTLPMPTPTGNAHVVMPQFAYPISVGLQDDVMVVWARVVADGVEMRTVVPRRFIIANTGQEIPRFPDDARFLGTITTTNGIVWHVWVSYWEDAA